VLQNGGNSPESLILQKAGSSYADDIINDASLRSHTSHKSHASHSSGVSGRARTKTAPAKTPADKARASENVATSYTAYLTNSDVEKVTGLQGVQEKTEAFFLYFYDNSSKQILQVKFSPKEYFDYFKGDSNFRPLKGVGESAIVGMLNLPNQLLFIKGQNCITLTTFLREGTNLFLSVDQLASLAQIIASRL
jgi:hypothetical protein